MRWPLVRSPHVWGSSLENGKLGEQSTGIGSNGFFVRHFDTTILRCHSSTSLCNSPNQSASEGSLVQWQLSFGRPSVMRVRSNMPRPRIVDQTASRMRIPVARLLWLAPRRMAIAFIRGYRYFLSPFFGQHCRFHPTCSSYAIEALRRFGFLHGGMLAARRLVRCQPWCSGGIDYVPAGKLKLRLDDNDFAQ
jgi:uncharacterized protein